MCKNILFTLRTGVEECILATMVALPLITVTSKAEPKLTLALRSSASPFTVEASIVAVPKVSRVDKTRLSLITVWTFLVLVKT